MKKIFLLATAFMFTLAAMAQPAQQKADDVMKVNTEKHDFGKIKQNVPVSYEFELKNTSDKPLVIENSWASCGCTTPEKITEPIAPGATAKLKVQYNAAAVAPFTKDVYIKIAGIDQPKTVQITGEVIAAEATTTDATVKEVKVEPKVEPVKEQSKTTTPAKTSSKEPSKFTKAPVKN